MADWDPVTASAVLSHQLRVTRGVAASLAEAGVPRLLPDPAEWSGSAADAFRDAAEELGHDLRVAEALAQAAASDLQTALAVAAGP